MSVDKLNEYSEAVAVDDLFKFVDTCAVSEDVIVFAGDLVISVMGSQRKKQAPCKKFYTFSIVLTSTSQSAGCTELIEQTGRTILSLTPVLMGVDIAKDLINADCSNVKIAPYLADIIIARCKE